MRMSEVAGSLGLELLTENMRAAESRDVSRGFASDMLSDVLAGAPHGGLLVTVQVHMNVVAVAVHAGLAAIVFASGRRPPEEVAVKAAEEGVLLYSSNRNAFDLVGELYALGLRGGR